MRPPMSQKPHLDGAADGLWTRRALLLLAAILVLRVGYLALGLTDLVPDESYYWEWSRQLDWCYYSKPPMVAWIIGLSTRLFESTTFFVRLPAPLLSTSALLAMFLLARRMWDAEVGFYAVLAMALTVGSTVVSLLMTIDPPLVAAWSFSMLLVWRALDGRGGVGAWVLAGLVVAFGLLSKPSMLAFPGLLLLYLALRERGQLARLGPWVSVLVSLTAFVPILWWNSQNDWITFGHAADHFTPGEEKPLFQLKTFGDFLGVQAALVTPLTFLLFMAVLGAGLLRLRSLDRASAFALVFSGVPMAVMFLLSFKQRVHGNWSAPFLIGGVLLLAAWARGRVSLGPRVDRLRSAFLPGLWVGAAFCLLVTTIPAWLPHLPETGRTSWIAGMVAPGGFLVGFWLFRRAAIGPRAPFATPVLTFGVVLVVLGSALPAVPAGGTRKDPTYRVRGWKELGDEIGQRLAEVPDPERTFIVGTKREYVSGISFYAPGHPVAFREPRDRIESQYELWGGPVGYEGWDALIVCTEGYAPPERLGPAFESMTRQEPIRVELGAGGGRAVEVHLARNLLAWPHPER